jgi:hypothetical protein
MLPHVVLQPGDHVNAEERALFGCGILKFGQPPENRLVVLVEHWNTSAEGRGPFDHAGMVPLAGPAATRAPFSLFAEAASVGALVRQKPRPNVVVGVVEHHQMKAPWPSAGERSPACRVHQGFRPAATLPHHCG